LRGHFAHALPKLLLGKVRSLFRHGETILTAPNKPGTRRFIELSMVVDAAQIEPVSAVKFPSIREKKREFRKFEGWSTIWRRKIADIPNR
jgi:hypothetical protein